MSRQMLPVRNHADTQQISYLSAQAAKARAEGDSLATADADGNAEGGADDADPMSAMERQSTSNQKAQSGRAGRPGFIAASQQHIEDHLRDVGLKNVEEVELDMDAMSDEIEYPDPDA